MLFVLCEFFSKKGVKLNPKRCVVVDVFAGRIFTAANMPDIKANIDKNTLEILGKWDFI